MKRWISIVLCFLLPCVFSLTANASRSYVVDEAGLLTAEEATVLEERCSEFYATSGMEIVILTVNSLQGKTATAYADGYFDVYYGEDGILLLIAMAEREWHISTAGTAIEAFIDADLMVLEDNLMKHLPDDEYNEAFTRFLSDSEYLWNDEPVSDFEASLFIGIPTGAVIALIVLLILRSTMNTKRAEHSAASYEVDGSYNLRRHQDLFLYSKVTKTEKPKDTNNSSPSSTTHTSSSGKTHGGRGGKF